MSVSPERSISQQIVVDRSEEFEVPEYWFQLQSAQTEEELFFSIDSEASDGTFEIDYSDPELASLVAELDTFEQWGETVVTDPQSLIGNLNHQREQVLRSAEYFSQNSQKVFATFSSVLGAMALACGPFCVHSMGALLGSASSSASLGAGGLFPSLGLGSWATGSTESPKGTGVESSPSSLGTQSTRLSHEKSDVSTGILELFCLGLPGLCDALIPNSLHAD